MRKGEIARLTWDMLDRTGAPWVLRIPGAITKNRTGRTLGLEGEVKAIIERRLRLRRFNVPLIFHRVCRGKPGRPITDFWDVWRNALQAAGLPSGRLLQDLRRAVRTLIRAGAYLTTQPTRTEMEKGQLRDIRENGGGKSLSPQARVGSSGRIRTGEDPPTPDDSDPLDPGDDAT